MSIAIIDSTGVTRNVLVTTDFAPEAFECTLTGLVPTVVTDGVTITGDGTPGDPLVAVSSFTFSVDADAGAAEPIANGDTLLILGGASIATAVSATDTVTVNLVLSTDAGQDLIFGTDGNIFFNETVTTLTQNNATSEFTYTSENGTVTTVRRVSADAGNAITIGTDGGAYYPVCTMTLAATSGPSQTISCGDTISLLQGDGIATVASATDTVTFSVRLDPTPAANDILAFNGSGELTGLETVTTLTQNNATSEFTYTSEDGTVTTVRRVSADVGNVIAIGTDGGAYYDGAGIVTNAVWDDANNEIDITFSDGSTISIPIIDAIGNFIVTNTLAGDLGAPQTITNGDTITIAGGASISTTAGATDTVTVNLVLSTDVGQNLVFGTDGNVLFAPASSALCPVGYFVGR